MYSLLSDFVLLVHFAFIVFVLGGGMLLLRWPRFVWLHFPAVVWAVFIEVSGWVCPLTPLENYFRALAGGNVYHTGFVERYLLPLIYPAGLTPAIQMLLAAVVIVLNIIIYLLVVRRHRRGRHAVR
ncbi:MAG: hypothetical protein B7Y56_04945 [Gallionellales bacterium 35-53-114]|nr:MAG: hypothetical protein B7Y56_04945 [Gallionellales bacterium 35-53-114]OYZ65433.1 MAG: hypothetical protein B7Y04_02100 [Gallionellales bacterium 24-53-125]OZB08339.1 MAG: hypothetical protein B7X61_12555 [Gallionellales bacterium 39-52-133]HQS58280.1 DUF2784 domain-containing protein [Gallionellaceae bacterium]HQS73835.1 DUF2784 domain-containing protein [Gallionellaceae bacterium]